ncbi:phytanoyl-CoA dioxygenase family protein [Novosphingobium sp. G106]|uniref:phytanoyl-CoA dioxygenase family protein n=1 Tax=Novosphingobium sp. G106 TaxID=2849500 RepID=UPI001C2CFAB1|nr:phytanoyl-CoA dioxygenase family protein [Novosphingobium sp. G106]MBV1691396.1 phytanoyl-CoA dioxygenase family protein [Novosphingobium sp. G106]
MSAALGTAGKAAVNAAVNAGDSADFAAGPEAASWLEQLNRNGYCIVPGLLPRETMLDLDREVAERFLDTPFSRGDFYGERTKRFGRLLMRAAVAPLLAEHPAILAIARALLGPYCDTIQLNVMQAIEIHPGEIAQVPHRDQDMWHGPKGEIEYLLNVMWPLTPFREENGATVIWPQSHGAAALAEPYDRAGHVAQCDPGDAILFLGSSLHAAGANRSTAPRRGIVAGYSLGWLKPYENLWLAYPPEAARHFSPNLAALAGYRQHRPNLGNVDGQCPSRLLGGDPGTPVAATDALMPEQQAMVAQHAARERARQGPPLP